MTTVDATVMVWRKTAALALLLLPVLSKTSYSPACAARTLRQSTIEASASETVNDNTAEPPPPRRTGVRPKSTICFRGNGNGAPGTLS